MENVWIVGASSGIGEAMAKAMDQPQYRLILSARREERLKQVARHIKTEVVCLPADVSDFSAHERVYQSAVACFGAIDIFVWVVGISQRTTFWETSSADFQRIMDLNFNAAVSLTSCVIPAMIERNRGTLVVFNSLQGKIALPQRTGYVAAKHALLGFFNSLRLELDAHNIHVLNVLPAYVNTEFSLQAIQKDEQASKTIDPNHLKGVAPEQVAKQTLEALKRRKLEIHPGRLPQTIGLLLQRMLPMKWFFKIIRAKYD